MFYELPTGRVRITVQSCMNCAIVLRIAPSLCIGERAYSLHCISLYNEYAMERILRSTIPISHLRLNMLRIAPCASYGAAIGRTTPPYQHSTLRTHREQTQLQRPRLNVFATTTETRDTRPDASTPPSYTPHMPQNSRPARRFSAYINAAGGVGVCIVQI